MSDVGTQLRTYFDETVERVTEEDIRIRATTERGIPVPSPRFRPRPLAAVAIGFGLAMTLLGVVLVADRVFGSGVVGDVGGTGGGGELVPSSEKGSLWLFLPVVFGLGLLATGIISARQRYGDMRERGEEIMQTVERIEAAEAPLDDEILTLKRRSRWLGWLAGILAVVVVGLGAWLMMELTSGSSETAPTAEIEQLLADYKTAWSEADADAYLSLLTDDYTVESGAYGVFTGPEQTENFEPGKTGVEIISDYTMIGTGPWYVTMASRLDSIPPYGASADVVSVVKIVEENGVLKVAYHKVFGPEFD